MCLWIRLDPENQETLESQSRLVVLEVPAVRWVPEDQVHPGRQKSQEIQLVLEVLLVQLDQEHLVVLKNLLDLANQLLPVVQLVLSVLVVLVYLMFQKVLTVQADLGHQLDQKVPAVQGSLVALDHQANLMVPLVQLVLLGQGLLKLQDHL